MIKLSFLFLSIFILATAVSAQQAKRISPDWTDTLNLDNTRGLTYIDLTTEEDVFTQKKISKKPGKQNYYFRVAGEDEYTKVSYLGTNLAEYMTEIDEPLNMMRRYQYSKATRTGLLYSGIALTLIGGVLYFAQNNELSPVLIIGVGFVSLSWVPYLISHNLVPEAVGLYNAKIGERDTKTSIKKSKTAPQQTPQQLELK